LFHKSNNDEIGHTSIFTYIIEFNNVRVVHLLENQRLVLENLVCGIIKLFLIDDLIDVRIV
jgi:hypothetical protein